MDAPALITRVRYKLVEASASYWTDAEILDHINEGIADLWRAICDDFQDYFFSVSPTVAHAASASTLSNLPTNVAKVLSLEPASRASYPSLNYFPRPYSHAEAAAARGADAIDPASGGAVYYSITGAGAPVGTPTIYVAPALSSAVTLSLAYVPTTPKLTNVAGQENPCPGESDKALIAYATAYALAKEREDRKPDPDWLSAYATEKTNVLTFLTPRQEDEPQVAEAVHQQFIDG